jgi:hypothetical protein
MLPATETSRLKSSFKRGIFAFTGHPEEKSHGRFPNLIDFRVAMDGFPFW